MPLQRQWLEANKAFFLRDLVRDYCKARNILEEQLERFVSTGTLSYAVLHELLGEAAHQGLFWQLKDKAHHVLRAEENDPCAQALDWAIGYAFHECVKLKEDAFQHQHYRSRLLHLCAGAGEEEGRMLESLAPLLLQTRDSAARELERILYTLDQCRVLFIHYLARNGEQPHLARFFAEHKELVQQGFGDMYESLTSTLYGSQSQQMLLLAARSCLEGGRPQWALDMLRQANFRPAENNPESPANGMQSLHKLATLALQEAAAGQPAPVTGQKP